MELLIQKWGNSAAVRLPTELLRIIRVSPGDKLLINVCPGGVMLKAKRPAYSLADLIKQCDLSAKEPSDLAIWNVIKPVGREV